MKGIQVPAWQAQGQEFSPGYSHVLTKDEGNNHQHCLNLLRVMEDQEGRTVQPTHTVHVGDLSGHRHSLVYNRPREATLTVTLSLIGAALKASVCSYYQVIHAAPRVAQWHYKGH